jgi:2,3-diketo-5-methylthiopentyl-1-phosphate enolase
LLYAINLTGPCEEMLERARTLAADGAHMLLFNYLCQGLPMLAALRNDKRINIPLMAHPALAGAFYGSPAHGVSPQVLFGRLPRLAGADLVLFPSPYGSVALPKTDALEVADALRKPLASLRPSFPVPSAGIKGSMISDILNDFGDDVVVNAGTGIHDHVEGSLKGAKEFASALELVYTAKKTARV